MVQISNKSRIVIVMGALFSVCILMYYINQYKMEKVIKVEIAKESHTLLYLSLFKDRLKISDKELNVLRVIIDKYIEISANVTNSTYAYKLMFDTNIKRDLIEEAKITNGHFNTILTRLREKGALINGEINPVLIPANEIKFIFLLQEKKLEEQNSVPTEDKKDTLEETINEDNKEEIIDTLEKTIDEDNQEEIIEDMEEGLLEPAILALSDINSSTEIKVI